MEPRRGPGRPKLGRKTLTVALGDEIMEFITEEREKARELVGVAPTEQDLVRTLLLTAIGIVQSKREANCA